MFRYLLIAFIVFLLYWMLKGTLRRFLAPPPSARPRAKGRPAGRDRAERERVERPRPSGTGIDYSKIKDADYRDL